MRQMRGIIRNEGRYFLAECVECPVSTFGSTAAEAVSNLTDAVGGYLEEVRLALQRGYAVRMARRPLPDYWCGMIRWAFLRLATAGKRAIKLPSPGPRAGWGPKR